MDSFPTFKEYIYQRTAVVGFYTELIESLQLELIQFKAKPFHNNTRDMLEISVYLDLHIADIKEFNKIFYSTFKDKE